jgi:hypothetical protein
MITNHFYSGLHSEDRKTLQQVFKGQKLPHRKGKEKNR